MFSVLYFCSIKHFLHILVFTLWYWQQYLHFLECSINFFRGGIHNFHRLICEKNIRKFYSCMKQHSFTILATNKSFKSNFNYFEKAHLSFLWVLISHKALSIYILRPKKIIKRKNHTFNAKDLITLMKNCLWFYLFYNHIRCILLY